MMSEFLGCRVRYSTCRAAGTLRTHLPRSRRSNWSCLLVLRPLGGSEHSSSTCCSFTSTTHQESMRVPFLIALHFHFSNSVELLTANFCGSTLAHTLNTGSIIFDLCYIFQVNITATSYWKTYQVISLQYQYCKRTGVYKFCILRHFNWA